MFFAKNKEKNDSPSYCFLEKGGKGFTLVEVLVVLAIIVALAVLVIAGYQEGRPRLAVERAAEGLRGDINRARERDFSNLFYEDEGGDIIGGGHGIFIEENSYSFFTYNNEEERVDIETIDLENIIYVSNIDLPEGVSSLAGGGVKVFFKKGEVYFNKDKAGDNTQLEVTFSAKADEDIKRIVSIDSSGKVEVIYEYD